MQAQLSSLTKEFTATSAAAQRTLKGLFGRRPAKPVVEVDSMPTAQLRPGYGGSTGALPSSASGPPHSWSRPERTASLSAGKPSGCVPDPENAFAACKTRA